MTPTMLSLLAAIREYPDEDTPRLMFADAAIEGGFAEWGEFIRVQMELQEYAHASQLSIRTHPRWDWLGIRQYDLWPAVRKWFEGEVWEVTLDANLKIDDLNPEGTYPPVPIVLVRRGFPSRVRCTLDQWRGGVCRSCGGSGRDNAPYGDRCDDCRRKIGRTPGIGPRLAQRWPIVEVEVTDAVVIRKSGGNDTYYVGGLGMFPQKYWRQLEGHRTPSASRAALSAVLIAEARGRAEVLATA